MQFETAPENLEELVEIGFTSDVPHRISETKKQRKLIISRRAAINFGLDREYSTILDQIKSEEDIIFIENTKTGELSKKTTIEDKIQEGLHRLQKRSWLKPYDQIRIVDQEKKNGNNGSYTVTLYHVMKISVL